MATVLVGAYGADPSTIWPEKYSSCFWNFITGWTCQTVDAVISSPTPTYPAPTTTAPLAQSPLSGSAPLNLAMTGKSGCCNCSRSSGALSASAPAIASGSAPAPTSSGCGCGGKCQKPEALGVFYAIALIIIALGLLADG